MREWRKTNPRAAKSADLKKCFGIGIAEYDALFAMQNGVCAICGSPPGKRALHVDHCHATGVIRGLLCGSCNTSLGLMQENAERLQKAIAYLAKQKQ